METLPAEPASFSEKKQRILRQLSVPDAAYTDASPKGSVDEGIRDLIADVNAVPGFVTTSSCAGRISVFVEGRKSLSSSSSSAAAAEAAPGNHDVEEAASAGRPARQQAATSDAAVKPASSSGGKGGGGRWLFVSHDPLLPEDAGRLVETLGLGDDREQPDDETGADAAGGRLIHFKFEPMILHVLTASPQHAQLLLKCAIGAGFRESGATGICASPSEVPTPMVGIRSMGLGFESLVGAQVDRGIQLLVTPSYLKTMVEIGNQRFEENANRVARFRTAFLEATNTAQHKQWEDAETRRARKKEEGLRRREQLRKEQQS